MIIKHADMQVTPETNFAGGQGVTTFTELVPLELLRDEAKLFKHVTIDVGASIGPHSHVDNYEVYYILSGQGEVDDNGTPVSVEPGDVVYTADGATHSLTNTGDVPIEMVAVIIYENKGK